MTTAQWHRKIVERIHVYSNQRMEAKNGSLRVAFQAPQIIG